MRAGESIERLGAPVHGWPEGVGRLRPDVAIRVVLEQADGLGDHLGLSRPASALVAAIAGERMEGSRTDPGSW